MKLKKKMPCEYSIEESKSEMKWLTESLKNISIFLLILVGSGLASLCSIMLLEAVTGGGLRNQPPQSGFCHPTPFGCE